MEIDTIFDKMIEDIIKQHPEVLLPGVALSIISLSAAVCEDTGRQCGFPVWGQTGTAPAKTTIPAAS